MLEFITGPLLWITLLVFIGGVIYRAVWYINGLDWKLDRVAYRAHPKPGLVGAFRSIFFWLIPFGTHSWREQPFMAIVFFLFHIGIVFVPLFLVGHVVFIEQTFGLSWVTMNPTLADILTVLVIVCGVLLVLRRIALAHVRILTTCYDYLLIVITVAPFLTGFMAVHSGPENQAWLIAHIIAGEIMLLAVPFTKLSHAILFFMSRGQLGADYGIKRGGMRGKHLTW